MLYRPLVKQIDDAVAHHVEGRNTLLDANTGEVVSQEAKEAMNTAEWENETFVPIGEELTIIRTPTDVYRLRRGDAVDHTMFEGGLQRRHLLGGVKMVVDGQVEVQLSKAAWTATLRSRSPLW